MVFRLQISVRAVGSGFRLEVQRIKDGAKTLNSPVPVEVFENLSVSSDDRRFVQTVINEESSLVRVESIPDGTPNPTAAEVELSDGADGAVLVPGSAEFQTHLSEDNLKKRFDAIDLFNLMAVPGEGDATVLGAVQHYCLTRRALLIADTVDKSFDQAGDLPDQGLLGDNAKNGAQYFPWVKALGSASGKPRPGISTERVRGRNHGPDRRHTGRMEGPSRHRR